MKKIKAMNPGELAAPIQDSLLKNGIRVVMSVGSAVWFYGSNPYVSMDRDLINTSFTIRNRIRSVMEELGFHQQGGCFLNADTPFFVEFPDGPLSVGKEPVMTISEFKLKTGALRILSATDGVKDRLCAYYWNDRQGLAQAILVSKSQKVDLKETKRRSKKEGIEREFGIFKKKFDLS